MPNDSGYLMDPCNLDRFIEAQNPVYDQVCSELRTGLKLTHWMWFIFPQIEGLGSSAMTIKYSISSLEEASEYLQHPILGTRLLECSQLVTGHTDRTLKRILGATDSVKFWSSMTLFAHSSPDNQVFKNALHKFFSDHFDQSTLGLLRESSATGVDPVQ